MNRLHVDESHLSLIKAGEELCGDHVEVIEEGNKKIYVLADGLGSGVKASILSTLTAKILSTLLASGISFEEAVKTVVETLPVCKERGVAYSTFTIFIVTNNDLIEIINYDNPLPILIRDGVNYNYDIDLKYLGKKEISYAKFNLLANDILVAMSDGCIHAGVGMTLNFGWEREEIISFLEPLSLLPFTAKTLNKILIDQCNALYGSSPGDDTTALVLHLRERQTVNLMIGPSREVSDTNKMLNLFFSKEGKHIVSGGTTSKITAKYLNKELIPSLDYYDKEVPPIAYIEGVDLVTEGVVTIDKVLKYANDHLADDDLYSKWSIGKDGASQIARILFEEATDINFFVGKAINPAHQNPDLPISFNIKMQLIESLAKACETMGKKVTLNYF